jgi:phytol kinase
MLHATTLSRAAPLLRAPALRVAAAPTASVVANAGASLVAAASASPLASLSAAAVAAPVARDSLVAVFLVIASVLWIKICNGLAGAGVTSQYVSRKLVHMGSGPLFVLFWPLFSTTPSAQLAAAAVPVLSLLRLYVAGTTGSEPGTGGGLVKAISRSGDKREALEGPFYYTIVLLVAVVCGWRNAVSVIAINQMAIGDGMADIIGRRFGKTKWPTAIEPSGKKSVEGTAAFAGFAFVACMLMVAVYNLAGLTALPLALIAPRIALISLGAAIVELLPLGDDNLTVPSAAAIMSVLLLRGL